MNVRRQDRGRPPIPSTPRRQTIDPCNKVLVFAKFQELWSVRQTFQWFRDHDVELPANPVQGTGLVWKIPSQSLIRDILRNPFFAGAYIWGRRPVTTLLVEGRLE